MCQDPENHLGLFTSVRFALTGCPVPSRCNPRPTYAPKSTKAFLGAAEPRWGPSIPNFTIPLTRSYESLDFGWPQLSCRPFEMEAARDCRGWLSLCLTPERTSPVKIASEYGAWVVDRHCSRAKMILGRSRRKTEGPHRNKESGYVH